jgi:hypothetical protein|tara:strand:+ start:4139 stop:4570 length:432 start_codon:yes stop_codon:yes gene_type:complete
MASNIKYPENQAMYFIEGDKLALITKVDSSGNGRTSSRKQWKAISEAVTDGILIHYYAAPNPISLTSSNLGIDNNLESAVVDYVKKCLYMDRAGASTEASLAQSSMAMANKHERNFKEAVQRHSVRKKDKTGGSRVVKVPNLV